MWVDGHVGGLGLPVYMSVYMWVLASFTLEASPFQSQASVSPICHMNRPVIMDHVRVCSVASVVSDSATPWTVAGQASLSMRFSRQESWSGLPCPPPGYGSLCGCNLSGNPSSATSAPDPKAGIGGCAGSQKGDLGAHCKEELSERRRRCAHTRFDHP